MKGTTVWTDVDDASWLAGGSEGSSFGGAAAEDQSLESGTAAASSPLSVLESSLAGMDDGALVDDWSEQADAAVDVCKMQGDSKTDDEASSERKDDDLFGEEERSGGHSLRLVAGGVGDDDEHSGRDDSVMEEQDTVVKEEGKPTASLKLPGDKDNASSILDDVFGEDSDAEDDSSRSVGNWGPESSSKRASAVEPSGVEFGLSVSSFQRVGGAMLSQASEEAPAASGSADVPRVVSLVGSKKCNGRATSDGNRAQVSDIFQESKDSPDANNECARLVFDDSDEEEEVDEAPVGDGNNPSEVLNDNGRQVEAAKGARLREGNLSPEPGKASLGAQGLPACVVATVMPRGLSNSPHDSEASVDDKGGSSIISLPKVITVASDTSKGALTSEGGTCADGVIMLPHKLRAAHGEGSDTAVSAMQQREASSGPTSARRTAAALHPLGAEAAPASLSCNNGQPHLGTETQGLHGPGLATARNGIDGLDNGKSDLGRLKTAGLKPNHRQQSLRSSESTRTSKTEGMLLPGVACVDQPIKGRRSIVSPLVAVAHERSAKQDQGCDKSQSSNGKDRGNESKSDADNTEELSGSCMDESDCLENDSPVDDRQQGGDLESDSRSSVSSTGEFDFGSDDEDDSTAAPKAGATERLSRVFDTDALREGLERGSEALDLVDGRHVVLVVGNTGAGKSTLIQGIAGKSLKQTEYTAVARGQASVKPVFEAEDPLSGFDIGHRAKSTTKFIRGFRMTRDDGSNIVYLDTPGRQDTDGPETDISTSVMLHHVAKKCRSLRFVILINYASLLEDRGGALREVLKLTRAYVDSFKKHRLSFLFRFTHTDEIREIAASERPADVLRNELIRTMEGTSESDIYEILSFMEICLKKGYEFVDILHPLRTDFAKLAAFIEKKLKPMEKPSIIGCGLTMPLQLTLAAGMQGLAQRCRILVGKPSSISLKRAKEIQAEVLFVQRFVDIEGVRKEAQACTDKLAGHLESTRRAIEAEIHRGTDPFGGAFGDEHVTQLRDLVSQLQLLTGDRSVESGITLRIEDAVGKLHQELIRSLDGKVDSPVLGNSLDRLKSWSDGYEQLTELYANAVARVETVTRTKSLAAMRFDARKLDTATAEEMSTHIQILCSLKLTCEDSLPLSSHLVNTNLAEVALQQAQNDIVSTVQSWSSMNMQPGAIDEAVLGCAASRFGTLVRLQQLFNRSYVGDQVVSAVSSAHQAIEITVTEHLTAVCARLKDASSDFGAAWQGPLTGLHRCFKLFSEFSTPRWHELRKEYERLLGTLCFLLAEDLRGIEGECRSLERDGITDGHAVGKRLATFASLRWFDDMLRPEDRFVENRYMVLASAFKQRIGRVAEDIEQQLSLLLVSGGDSSTAVLALKSRLLSELRQISAFGLAQGTPDELESSVRAKLQEHVRGVGQRARSCLRDWKNAIQDTSADESSLESSCNVMNSLLRELQTVRSLDSNCDKIAKSAVALIYKSFTKYKHYVEKIMARPESYAEKAACLATVGIMSKFSHLGPPVLPDLKEMKARAKAAIRQEEEAIGSFILEESDWGAINKRLDGFKSASSLDPHILNTPTLALQRLEAVKEKKSAEADSRLQDLIDRHDVVGMREILESLSESTSMLQQQCYDRCKTKICTALTRLLDGLHMRLSPDAEIDLQTAKEVVRELEILDAANSHLKTFLRGEIILKRDIVAVVGKFNKALLILVDQMVSSAEKKELRKLSIQKRLVLDLENAASRYLTKETKKKMHEALATRKSVLLELPGLVDKFVDSRFKDSDGLLDILSELRSAMEKDDPRFTDLTDQYTEMTTKLVTRLNGSYRDLQNLVEENHCFGDAITSLNELKKQLDEYGLREHAVDFKFDCQGQLDSWRKQQQEHEHQMDFGRGDVKLTLREWASNLDRLHPSSWSVLRWRKWMNDGTSYNRLKEKLSGIVAGRFEQGKKALLARDMQLVQERIVLLDLIVSTVGKHIEEAQECRDVLKQMVLEAFDKLCAELQAVLQSNNIRHFESLFADYRGFVLHVSFLMRSTNAKRNYGLTNQLVFEVLEREIEKLQSMVMEVDVESLDFAGIKTQVETVRAFGGFVADRFSILQEELKSRVSGQSDKWLAKIVALCLSHFGAGRDFGRIKFYAVLGLPPSATKADIMRVYREKETVLKSDETAWRDLKLAFDELQQETRAKEGERPFDDMLKGIRDHLQSRIREYLSDQRYDAIDALLARLGGLSMLSELVRPALDADRIKGEIALLVRNHVDRVRVEVDSNWSDRAYGALQDNICDLKLMETSFKAYPDIYSSSWNNGIVEHIEAEIESLCSKAKACLTNKELASAKFDEFRWCFVRMGFVLVELPFFKDFTMSAMNSVLESCLDSSWGSGFLFEFGLSLQKGDDNASEDENRVAQVIVSQFQHFKDVQTLVWNEETVQKPVEDTIQQIRGELRTATATCPMELDLDALLRSYYVYEAEFKAMLADPDADLNKLVRKVVNGANQLKTGLSSASGWSAEVKDKLPGILAGVFVVFTVLKSGASFNRLESAAEGGVAIGEKLLMKPHSIQVLTILVMFGCGCPSSTALESSLMQIRTGEGKSLILGAASVMLGLLGFRVRCVCYSAYLSDRDYNLFRDIFVQFQLTDAIKYSKITTLSEDTTTEKGDIRGLTERLLRGELTPTGRSRQSSADLSEEILLIDEVDVMFGSDFYGKTYNQVTSFREPEIVEILKLIWTQHKRGQTIRLAEVKTSKPFKRLLDKFPAYQFLFENEIALMMDQVKRVDEESYFLDQGSDRIGYKIHDSVSFEASYGYRTVFAYLQEADKDNLKNKDETLDRELAIPLSVGQFSYAAISPAKILGVSGTLEALGKYERDVMSKYGIESYMYVPSVYGQSNFQFDKAGTGIFVEASQDDFYVKITEATLEAIRQKRAVMIFFQDHHCKRYTSSAYYRKLGRQKKLLTAEMTAEDKAFVISKAATAGQVTICSHQFGRGTDFFCKDERVQASGGPLVIQTFLSRDRSEEIQIQGRTARQGKKGSYQMILLESDLEEQFEILPGEKDRIAREDRYDWLCRARDRVHAEHCQTMETDLVVANEKDKATHRFFDALIDGDKPFAHESFKALYKSIKTGPVAIELALDLALLVDVTGSMGPFVNSAAATLESLIRGKDSIIERLKPSNPCTEFRLRIAVVGFRDIDDCDQQFQESSWSREGHFTEDPREAVSFLANIASSPSGGGDLAEDHLGVIHRCSNWSEPGDWSSQIKFMMLLTDAPNHGMVPTAFGNATNADAYAVRHPDGLTTDAVVAGLLSKDIDLMLCSFNPAATADTEAAIAKQYLDHPDNKNKREISVIPMVTPINGAQPSAAAVAGTDRHIVFALDESGSMHSNWAGVVKAYNDYVLRRRQNQTSSDLVSVVQFAHSSRISVKLSGVFAAPSSLQYNGGGTSFYPAAVQACQLARETPTGLEPVVVFMSDGQANDAAAAANEFRALNAEVTARTGGTDLELHVIAFGAGASMQQLQQIADTCANGKLHQSADTCGLSDVFVEIAGGQDVAAVLQSEIAKHVSMAVSDKVALEFRSG